MIQTLFEKIEAATIETADLLASADRARCNEIFEQYSILSKTLDIVYTATRTSIEGLKHAGLKCGSFSYNSGDVIDKLEKTFEAQEALNKSFVNRIEGHFAKTYNLKFITLEERRTQERQARNSRQAWSYEKPLEHPHPVYPNYDFVIKNMLDQTGSDFVQTAFTQQLEKLHSCFYWQRDAPHIKGQHVALPDFAHLSTKFDNRLEISYNETQVHTLFACLSYLSAGNFALTDEFNELYKNLKNEVEAGTWYEANNYRIKFYKNGKVELQFPQSAQRFWDKFRMNEVVEKCKTAR